MEMMALGGPIKRHKFVVLCANPGETHDMIRGKWEKTYSKVTNYII